MNNQGITFFSVLPCLPKKVTNSIILFKPFFFFFSFNPPKQFRMQWNSIKMIKKLFYSPMYNVTKKLIVVVCRISYIFFSKF